MGKNITLVGGNGDGQTTKVANQIIVALTIEAVGEALLFASKAGADPARVRQALMGGFAASRILEVHGERMVKRNFAPGFRIELHQKDLNLALQGARALGVSLPNTATCQELFNAAVAAGGKAWDHSGMVRVLETLAVPSRSARTPPGWMGRTQSRALLLRDVRRRGRGGGTRGVRAAASAAAAARPHGRGRRRQGGGRDGAGGRGALAGRPAAVRAGRHPLRPRRRPLRAHRGRRGRATRCRTRPGRARGARILDAGARADGRTTWCCA